MTFNLCIFHKVLELFHKYPTFYEKTESGIFLEDHLIFSDTFSLQFRRRYELLMYGKTIELEENIFRQKFIIMDFYWNKFHSQIIIQYSNSRRTRLRALCSSGFWPGKEQKRAKWQNFPAIRR